jgi:hypothetical protein
MRAMVPIHESYGCITTLAPKTIMVERATYAAIVGACFAWANMAKDLILDDLGIPPGGPIRVARGKGDFILLAFRIGIVCFFDDCDFV